MATYKNIKGFEIQYLDSDPTTSNDKFGITVQLKL